MVGEHSTGSEDAPKGRLAVCKGRRGREAGARGKDFAGISSDNDCGNQSRRKPKVSCVKFVCAGLVGP
jgi:hypothetical protein